ncbi:MAG TPA: hypothetical protein EYN27_04855 [Rhodospirillales bacterium]|nr:hypothetical protein [Rhodospirillales bacterium]
MKRLLPVLMGFALLLLTSTEGWSLPPCPGSYNKTTWTDCIGTDTYMGTKYVSEWKDGVRREQVVMANLSIFRQIWYFDIA